MFPLIGCATCRSRRIKCDRSLPRCQRCIKSNRICIARNRPGQERATEKNLIRRTTSKSLSSCIPRTVCSGLTSHHRMLQWRSTRPPEMQDAIDYFLSNFVLDTGRLPGLFGRGSIETFDIVPAETGPGRAVIEVLDTLTAGFLMIRASSLQTIEGRRKQHINYRKAMGELRQSISLYPNSRALVAPIFLFALYEMIVNTSLADRTWQTHSNGLLAMLQHNQNTRGNCIAEMTGLSAARQFALSEETSDIQGFLSSHPLTDSIEKAWLLLHVTKVQLRTFITTMDRFCAIDDAQLTMHFKKLDVEKVRVSVKRIQRGLCLFPDLIPKEYHPIRMINSIGCDFPTALSPTYIGYYEDSYPDTFLCTKWNEYRSLLLITGDFLLRTGRFLYAGMRRSNARETTGLARMMKEAADGICASVPSYCTKYSARREEADVENAWKHTTPMKTLDALNLMWPVHCAIATESGATEAQRGWMKELLLFMGCNMRIPKAMALADTHMQAFTYSEALASLTLLGSGVLRSVQ